MAYNIPDSAILLDYNGTRTLNSIKQAKNTYALDCATIISQEYHNERAIFLSNRYDIKAIAYNAKTPMIINKLIKNNLREYLARVKMFIDFFWVKMNGIPNKMHQPQEIGFIGHFQTVLTARASLY